MSKIAKALEKAKKKRLPNKDRVAPQAPVVEAPEEEDDLPF